MLWLDRRIMTFGGVTTGKARAPDFAGDSCTCLSRQSPALGRRERGEVTDDSPEALGNLVKCSQVYMPVPSKVAHAAVSNSRDCMKP